MGTELSHLSVSYIFVLHILWHLFQELPYRNNRWQELLPNHIRVPIFCLSPKVIYVCGRIEVVNEKAEKIDVTEWYRWEVACEHFDADRHDPVFQLFQVHWVSWRKCIYCLIQYLCCQQMELPSIQLLVPVQGESSWEDVTDVCMKWLTRCDVRWIIGFCGQWECAGYAAKMCAWLQCRAAWLQIAHS